MLKHIAAEADGPLMITLGNALLSVAPLGSTTRPTTAATLGLPSM